MDVVMIRKLKKPDIPSPENKGFLSHEQLQVVESKRTPAEQMNTVIDYLLAMEDICFEYFCQILEQCALKEKARVLRNIAKDLKERRFSVSLNISNTHACALTLQTPVA